MRALQHDSQCLLRLAFLLLALLIALSFAGCKKNAGDSPDLALVGAKVYPSPNAAPIEDAVVLVHKGAIAEIGKRGDVKIPKSDQVIDCAGKVITAGFWNSHVHFTEDVWNDAATASPGQD